jgi:acyl transferase domain-containing protein/phosphopantetheinyl transferase
VDRSKDIAVVGMACVFPGARNVEQFWANNVNGIDAVTGIPEGRWPAIRFHELPVSHVAHIGCSRGGFVPSDLSFDGPALGVMPSIVRSGDPDQFVMLDVADAALRDAGIGDGDPVRGRTDVIIGRGGYMSRKTAEIFLRIDAVARIVPFLRYQLPDMSAEDFAALEQRLHATLPATDPESLTTAIPNLVASRVSNRLNLRGSAYVVDAACASSLIAVEQAVARLRGGQCDAAIAAGIHLCQYPPFWYVFTTLRAMSLSGVIRPFDRRADGLLLGEGAGAVVLKRLADALRDGERIYAVIKGAGSASDGRDTGVLAPSTAGQIEALRRAYADAELDPRTISFLEAHGTATLAGDAAEIETIKGFYGTAALPQGAMGSVKSMIGHTMPAAGMASLIRTVLALWTKTLPPTIHCEQPREEFADAPFYVNDRTLPWIHPPGRPRRAGINAFGFGGINCHVILEEPPAASSVSPRAAGSPPIRSARRWPSEALLFSAPSAGVLAEHLERLDRFLGRDQLSCRLEDVAFSLLPPVDFSHSWKLALVCETLDDARRMIAATVARLRQGNGRRHDTGEDDGEGVYLSSEAAQPRGKVALLFPGLISPDPLGDSRRRLLELCLHFPELRDTLDRLEEKDGNPDDPASFSYILDPPRSLPEPRRKAMLERLLPPLAIAEDQSPGPIPPAERNLALVGVILSNWLGWRLLETLEVPVDMACGQSIGDWTALCCAGAVDFDRHVMADVWRSLSTATESLSRGCLAFVAAGEPQVRPYLADKRDTWIAAYLSPESVLLGGGFAEIHRAVEELRSGGIFAASLPYAVAHCPALADVRREADTLLERHELGSEFRIPVYSSLTADLYPTDPAGIRRLLVANLDRPIRVWQTVRRLYDDGARIFIQAGSGALAANVATLLDDADVVSAATDKDSCDAVTGINHLVGALFTAGVRLNPGAVFRHRAPRLLHFDQPAPAAKEPEEQTRFLLGWPSYGLLSGSPTSPHPDPLPREETTAAPPPLPLGEGRGEEEAQHGERMPFAGKVIRHVPRQEIAVERHLDLDEDLYLLDHHFVNAASCKPIEQCLPVFPMAMMMELMAETAARLAPGLKLIGVENLRASRWIHLLDTRRIALHVEARLASADPQTGVHAVETQILHEGQRSASAVVLLGREYREDVAMRFPALQSALPWPISAEDLYRQGYLFHGPRFQTIAAAGLLGENGLTATLRVGAKDNLFASQPAPQMLSDPCVVDGAGQLVGCWTMARGRCVLPVGVEKIEFYRPPPPPGTEAPVRLEITSFDPASPTVYADIEVQDGEGFAWMRIRGWTDFFVPCSTRILDVQRLPTRHCIAETLALPELPPECLAVTISEAELREGDVNGIAILYLTAEELAGLKNMVERRQIEFILGRIAMKDAVRRWLARQNGGEMPHPASIATGATAEGKPFFRPIPGVSAIPEVSVTHSEGRAAAVVSPFAVGIDLEPVSRPTARILGDFALPEEIVILDQLVAPEQPEAAWPTRLWCAKEAAGKALGTGLAGRPRDFELLHAEKDGRMRICHRPSGRELTVVTACRDGMIVACCPGP